MEPSIPFLIWFCLSPSFVMGPVASQSPLYWFIWPTFSSSVISRITESTLRAIVVGCATENKVCKTSIAVNGAYDGLIGVLFKPIYFGRLDIPRITAEHDDEIPGFPVILQVAVIELQVCGCDVEHNLA